MNDVLSALPIMWPSPLYPTLPLHIMSSAYMSLACLICFLCPTTPYLTFLLPTLHCLYPPYPYNSSDAAISSHSQPCFSQSLLFSYPSSQLCTSQLPNCHPLPYPILTCLILSPLVLPQQLGLTGSLQTESDVAVTISGDLSFVIRDRHAPLETVLEEVIGQPFVFRSKRLEVLRQEAVTLVDPHKVLCCLLLNTEQYSLIHREQTLSKATDYYF